MTIALQIQAAKPKRFFSLKQILYFLVAPLYRLWWHFHAYTTVFGIMVLSLLSLVFLYVHDQFDRGLLKLHQRVNLQAK